MTPPADVAVIIASYRRPDVLSETLESLSRQTLMPAQVILSLTSEEDCKASDKMRRGVQLCLGNPGLPAQRNRGIRVLESKIRFVAFIDDDVETAPDYLEMMRTIFLQNEELAAFSGHVVQAHAADRAAARNSLAEAVAPPAAKLPLRVSQEGGLYGCSMNVRREVLENVDFDERLRRYGWLEDADFGVRVRAWGQVGSSEACRLYHLRAPQGRISGKAFGFAQVMNPFYLARKGTIPWREAWSSHAVKVVLSNLRCYVLGDKAVDRAGRLAGNWLAFRRLAAGRFVPEEIDSL